MPIYEYTCQSCKKKFDHLARTMNSDASVKCPECGSPKTARALSVFAVNAGAPNSAPKSGGGSCRCGGPGPCGH